MSAVVSVFYALYKKSADSKEVFIYRLNAIYQHGLIPSQQIKSGEIIPYLAQNGIGFILVSLFGMSLKGIAEPDFEDWELKAHSGNVITLMTLEPSGGEYKESLEQFLRKYSWSNKPDRVDFASIYKITSGMTELTFA